MDVDLLIPYFAAPHDQRAPQQSHRVDGTDRAARPFRHGIGCAAGLPIRCAGQRRLLALIDPPRAIALHRAQQRNRMNINSSSALDWRGKLAKYAELAAGPDRTTGATSGPSASAISSAIQTCTTAGTLEYLE